MDAIDGISKAADALTGLILNIVPQRGFVILQFLLVAIPSPLPSYNLAVHEARLYISDEFHKDGVGHESVRRAIARMATAAFWDAPETKRAVLARLPAYRLTKFQDCLPEGFALEVAEGLLLDVGGR